MQTLYTPQPIDVNQNLTNHQNNLNPLQLNHFNNKAKNTNLNLIPQTHNPYTELNNQNYIENLNLRKTNNNIKHGINHPVVQNNFRNDNPQMQRNQKIYNDYNEPIFNKNEMYEEIEDIQEEDQEYLRMQLQIQQQKKIESDNRKAMYLGIGKQITQNITSNAEIQKRFQEEVVGPADATQQRTMFGLAAEMAVRGGLNAIPWVGGFLSSTIGGYITDCLPGTTQPKVINNTGGFF